MKNKLLTGFATAALIAGSSVVLSQGAQAATYEITITNATKGQPLAPGLVILHDKGYSLFEIGGAATDPLATMAETGGPFDLQASIPASADTDVVLGDHGGIALPSESNSIKIKSEGKFLTVVGMLAATNDAFYAIRGVRLPTSGSTTFYATAFDAGSEANNELSGDVPASAGGNGDDLGTNYGDGEGFIHVHNGIFGSGDLDPIVYDWNNPVVEIIVEKIPSEQDED
ncbi:MAG: spondin domain-containing protein [Proteobacteria bacterium]|nr:spondin domain-containing protein [Pseudomonadota bacterium]